MARLQDILLPWTTVFSIDDDPAVFLPATPWMDAADVGAVRFSKLEVAGRIGNILVAGGWQTADVENSVAASGEVGIYQNGDGVRYPTDNGLEDISTATTGRQLIRFGYWVKLASGNTISFARVWSVLTIQARV